MLVPNPCRAGARFPEAPRHLIRRITPALLTVALALLTLPSNALAQPISPKDGGSLPEHALRLLQERPELFEFQHALKAKTARAEENRELLAQGKLGGSPDELVALTQVAGTVQVPIMLGLYADDLFSNVTASDLQQQLFDGPWPTGTMTDYYAEISYGALNVTGTVFNWKQVSQNGSYYTGSVNGLDPDYSNTDEFVREIVALNDGSVNFGNYDNDGPDGIPNSGDDDGYVDFIGIVHSDIGGEEGGSGMWSHRSSLVNWPAGVYTTNDGSANGGFIRVNDYTLMPALDGSGGMNPIGVYCHEFGHAFGLPDLYDTDGDNGKSEGIGHWGLMGSGNWNSTERPAHMCAWSKVQLGWIPLGTVVNDLIGWPLLSSTLAPSAVQMWTGGTAGTPESFIVEYRTANGFDEKLHAPGVLIWHLNKPAGNNKDEAFKFLDLECADQTGADHTMNADHLDQAANRGDAGDPFCTGDSFSPFTNPSSDSYNGNNTSVRVDVMTECGPEEIVLNLFVDNPNPNLVDLCMRDCGSDTCFEPSPCDAWWVSPEVYIDNNGDGIIDPPAEGIPNKLFARVQNNGGTAAAPVNVDFYQADPSMGLQFPSSAQYIGSDQIAVIGGLGDSDVAQIDWTIPTTPADVHHWCLGAVATNAWDGQSSQSAVQDNNVTQINIQELYAKAGSQAPKSAAPITGTGEFAAAKAAPEPWTTTKIVQICNVTDREGCGFDVRIGSPPNYDDAIIPDDWTVDLSVMSGFLNWQECVPLLVKVTDADAHHLDYARIPLTLLCNEEVIGGTVLEFHIDNFPPLLRCDQFEVTRELPPGTDNFPLMNAVKIKWVEDMEDVNGWPDRVERWKLYNGSTPDFTPSDFTKIAETCIDQDTKTAPYEHFIDVPNDESKKYFKIVAVDRAGNQSESCAVSANVFGTPAPETQDLRLVELSQNYPNPFNPSTEIRFSLPQSGPVRLDVYTPKGERVRRLISGLRPGGENRIVWDGKDDTGSNVASGVYVYQIRFADQSESRRMLLLK